MSTLETVRHPAVAGRFYTAVPSRLRAEVERYCATPAAPRARAYGVMVPHAGYMYSGAVCGRALASVEIPPLCLILHTKHQLGGGLLSLSQFEQWQTPLGPVAADPGLNAALAAVKGITPSNLPHFGEHAAEVVLPFLQVLRPDVRVAVISVMTAPPDLLQAAARGVAAAVLAQGSDVLLVASSDMNHYADHEETLRKDKLALDRLAEFDADGMLEVCARHDITMCGAHATALMLHACKALGATRVQVLEHTTSGEVSGEYGQVVGYASARVL
ncbi:MAG: AmmeMemoRadiSam system protein B [Planctomycetes bacterium]|nr:AmmeMemoRadiSam system protein B [Planctomycetota bacterium]MCL4729358.1 AmmeMemoRadiSam system protein B [Planctomycetota bacterium]